MRVLQIPDLAVSPKRAPTSSHRFSKRLRRFREKELEKAIERARAFDPDDPPEPDLDNAARPPSPTESFLAGYEAAQEWRHFSALHEIGKRWERDHRRMQIGLGNKHGSEPVNRALIECPTWHQSKRERAAHFIRVHSENRELLEQRLSPAGLLYPVQMAHGRSREAVLAVGLRSARFANVKRFVAAVPRRGRVEGGWSKDSVKPGGAGWWKALALDAPYVTFNKTFWAIMRCDVDLDFVGGLTELKAALVGLGFGLVLPHIVVWDDRHDGVVRRPHLIWILPAGAEVWNSDDERCLDGPRRLFRALHRALMDALRPIGGDTGCLAEPHHGKNPCSPYWAIEAEWNIDVHPDLEGWKRLRRPDGEPLLRLGKPLTRTLREAAAAWHGDATASQQYFSSAKERCWRMLATWRDTADPRYVGGLEDRSLLADSLYEALEETCEAESSPTAARRTLFSVARHEAQRFGPAKHPRVDRGRCMHLIAPTMSLPTRQSIAARETALRRTDTTLAKLAEAARSLLAAGERRLSARAVARVAEVSNSTASRHWANMLARIETDLKSGSRPIVSEGNGASERLTDELHVDLPIGTANDTADLPDPNSILTVPSPATERLPPPGKRTQRRLSTRLPRKRRRTPGGDTQIRSWRPSRRLAHPDFRFGP